MSGDMNSSFVGRVREIRRIGELLTGHRLVTLTGPGGVGKTSLALAAAAKLRGRFPGGTWLAELASLTEPEQVMEKVTDAILGVSGRRQAGVAEVVERTSGRATLLILDNCEQVIEGAAIVAAELVAGVPSLHILATSREPLRVAAETTLAVPTMPEEESVLLFIERAKARVPGFLALDETREAVREVCQRLDGLPLAIELAAARMSMLTPAQLLPLLGDRFAVLEAGRRDAPIRHRALRATVDWSFDLLDAAEQRLFTRLSVFVGGFDLSAAASVAGSNALRSLTALVDKSVVQPVDSGSANPRYRMLDTLREYGLERLAELGQTDEARLAHLEHFRQRAEATFVEGLVIGPPVQVRDLENDLDNLRAALAWSVDHAPGVGLRLAGAARDLWFTRAQADGLRLSRLLLERCPERDAYRARALMTAGQLANTLQRTGEAAALLEEARDISRASGAAEPLAWATWTLGVAGFLGEDPTAAQRSLMESRDMFVALGNRTGTGRATASLGTVQFLRGELDLARATLAEALAIAEEAFDPFGQGLCHLYLGLAASRAGEHPRADEHLRSAVRLLSELGDNTLLTFALAGIALNLGRSDRRRALRLAAAATALRGWIGGGFAPFMTEGVNSLRATAKGELGNAGVTEWDAGRSLGLEEAIRLALGGTQSNGRAQARTILSRREMEVARLVAEGLGNGAIADALHLSTRTVENHVFHVLAKLGLENRTQVAAWVLSSR
jgi:predicted ATPase/DNA-binding CsgD family transcriptional regulator